jgi:hypothetical protein
MDFGKEDPGGIDRAGGGVGSTDADISIDYQERGDQSARRPQPFTRSVKPQLSLILKLAVILII